MSNQNSALCDQLQSVTKNSTKFEKKKSFKLRPQVWTDGRYMYFYVPIRVAIGDKYSKLVIVLFQHILLLIIRVNKFTTLVANAVIFKIFYIQENNTWQAISIFDAVFSNVTELSVFGQSGNRIVIRWLTFP